jgi:diadenosine tetraphosphate (Ap4A) HIT family hydrolase
VTEAAPESIEDYYARILAATDDEGRLPVAVEEMPGWDIYPYELDSLRLKPLRPLADADPARQGERAQDCWCTQPPRPDDGTRVWRSERWVVHLTADSGLPIGLTLSPLEHHDLTDLPEELAGEMGRLITVISAAVEQVPSVGRVQLAKYGDGGAHLHLFFFGRPTRILQFRGSPLIDWEENLPRVPLEVLQRNARVVANHLVATVGGEAGRLDGPD